MSASTGSRLVGPEGSVGFDSSAIPFCWSCRGGIKGQGIKIKDAFIWVAEGCARSALHSYFERLKVVILLALFVFKSAIG